MKSFLHFFQENFNLIKQTNTRLVFVITIFFLLYIYGENASNPYNYMIDSLCQTYSSDSTEIEHEEQDKTTTS